MPDLVYDGNDEDETRENLTWKKRAAATFFFMKYISDRERKCCNLCDNIELWQAMSATLLSRG